MFLRNDRKNLTHGEKRPVLFVRTRRMRIRYSLSSQMRGSVTFYGIDVDLLPDDGRAGEHVSLPELCSDRTLAVRILRAMHRGAVTPCSAACVADDMLSEAVMENKLKDNGKSF